MFVLFVEIERLASITAPLVATDVKDSSGEASEKIIRIRVGKNCYFLLQKKFL